MTVKLVNHLRKACSITNSLQPDLYVRNGIKRSLVKLSQAHSGRGRWNIRKDILLMSYVVLWIESPAGSASVQLNLESSEWGDEETDTSLFQQCEAKLFNIQIECLQIYRL